MVNLSVLKAVGQHLWTSMASMIREELMRPQLHIAMLDEFGMQPFSKTKDAYRQTFEDYKRLRKQVVEPSATSRKTRPVSRCWSFKLQRLRQLP